MTGSKFDRNQRLLRMRAAGRSTRYLSREFGISQMRVRQLLDRLGDPLARDLADGLRPRVDILAELEERVACRTRDTHRIRELREELEVRRTDDVLGLG